MHSHCGTNIYSRMAKPCNEALQHRGKYFAMKDTILMTEKLTLIFSTFWGFFIALA